MTILIGTIHCNLEGDRQLEKVLSLYRPRSLSLEFPYGCDLAARVEEINKRIAEEQKKVSKGDLLAWERAFVLKSLSSIFYEGRLAHAYAQKEKIPLHCVDHPDLVGLDLSSFPSAESIVAEVRASPLELREALSVLSVKQALGHIVSVQNDWYKEPELIQKWFDALSPERKKELEYDPQVDPNVREQYMAEKILTLEPEMHIGGMAHMFKRYAAMGSPGVIPLYRRLGSLVTNKYPLAFACEERK